MTQCDHAFPVLRFSPEGRLVSVRGRGQPWLAGLERQAGEVGFESLFPDAELGDLLDSDRAEAGPVTLWLRRDDQTDMPLAAMPRRCAEGGFEICVVALEGSLLGVTGELMERVEILSQMIGAARDACWCIDFLEPVDLRGGEEEVIDQVFRNASRWRACNDAMAALYDVPQDQDFNTQPVSRYFPETPVNRAMIRDLIRTGYHLDGAQAIDQRHDGSAMLVENDFRAMIREDRLVRLWGTTRDIGPSRAREREISAEAEVMRDLLGAVPDPILMLSESGIVLAANPAAEDMLSAAHLLGQPFDQLSGVKGGFERIRAEAASEDTLGIDLPLRDGAGGRRTWELKAAVLPEGAPRYVVSARDRTRGARRRFGGRS